MAKQFGVSRSTVHEIWRARGLKPHLVKTFKVSTDPAFEAEVRRRGGAVSSNPPQRRWCCAYEKSQVQALCMHSAVAADGEGPRRNDDPRLQTQRHHHVVRRD